MVYQIVSNISVTDTKTTLLFHDVMSSNESEVLCQFTEQNQHIYDIITENQSPG